MCAPIVLLPKFNTDIAVIVRGQAIAGRLFASQIEASKSREVSPVKGRENRGKPETKPFYPGGPSNVHWKSKLEHAQRHATVMDSNQQRSDLAISETLYMESKVKALFPGAHSHKLPIWKTICAEKVADSFLFLDLPGEKSACGRAVRKRAVLDDKYQGEQQIKKDYGEDA